MIQIPRLSEVATQGKNIEVLFWVGCAGSYDARAQKVSLAFAQILEKAGISFAILGEEEKCTGDPARRAGNEFLFQILALELNFKVTLSIIQSCPLGSTRFINIFFSLLSITQNIKS